MKNILVLFVLVLTISSCSSSSGEGSYSNCGLLITKIVCASGGVSVNTATFTYVGNKIKDFTNGILSSGTTIQYFY